MTLSLDLRQRPWTRYEFARSVASAVRKLKALQREAALNPIVAENMAPVSLLVQLGEILLEDLRRHKGKHANRNPEGANARQDRKLRAV